MFEARLAVAQEPTANANEAVAVETPPDGAEAETQKAGPQPVSAAMALTQELRPMLSPAGLPMNVERAELVDLAARASRVARGSADGTAKLQAGEVEMSIYNALAQQAIASDRPGEASLRIAQLRSAARQTRELDAADAQAIGGFWLLQADMTDINRNERTLTGRQVAAMDRLQRFLGDVPANHPSARDAQVALLRLAVQAGDVATVRELLPTLSNALAADDPRRDHLAPARQMLAQIDRPAPPIEGVTLDTGITLLEFRTDAASPPALQEAHQLWKDRGVTVVTITPTPLAGATWAWPHIASADAFTAYGVTATPRYVLVQDGQVVSVAWTSAVVHEIPAMLQK